MLARIVDNWLTSSSELGYQAVFAQLLMSEGCKVLHAPVHHPFEHGKDLVALGPSGQLWAYQLKGGNLDLAGIEQIQGQLLALAGSAISYPGVEPPRLPDRAFLVTNGTLTAPARDRIRAFNDGNRQRAIPIIEVVEKEQLLARLVAAHGEYSPSELQEFNEVLSLVLADGRGPFPRVEYAKTLSKLLQGGGKDRSPIECQRTISSLTLLTAYVTGAWDQAGNNLGVAQGWLTLAIAILRNAAKEGLSDEDWMPSFLLARDSARQSLGGLLREATAADDLIIPHIVEGLVHPTRVVIVCGFCAALYLSERMIADGVDLADLTKRLLLREMDHVQMVGEVAAPFLLMMATALEVLGERDAAGKIVVLWARCVATANQPGGVDALADPYHSFEEILLSSINSDTSVDEEQFGGEAYSLHIALGWLVRRNCREVLETLWPDVTRIHFVEYQPTPSYNLLTEDDRLGQQQTWAPPMPASWEALRSEASTVREDQLPAVLWQHLEVLPYLPLILPFRLIGCVAKALDYAVTNRCEVTMAEDSEAVQKLR